MIFGGKRFCPECATKYKVVTTETVKYLKFIPARFEVAEEIAYVYACPKCGMMKRPQKSLSLLKGSDATPSLVASIMNAKYVNGMPLARQKREFARYDLNLSTKTMASWLPSCLPSKTGSFLKKPHGFRGRHCCHCLCKSLWPQTKTS